MNQVYSGLEARNYKTIRAVRSTRALVLTYKNKLINALFHSSSGGMTENSQDVWKSEYPYLSRVKDFDSNNPKLSWQKKFTHEKLEELFPKIGGLNKIEILSITETGRVKNIKIYGVYGTEIISGPDFRKKLNLKSSLVRFNFIEDTTNTLRDGFLAHEVSSIVPEAITGTKDAVDSDNNPGYQQIDQAKLVPLLTAALQEALTKIETLEAKVAALEGS